jgi:hypothetical protein
MVLDFKLAIEVMGEQHGKPVAFNGDKEEAKRNFETQVIRDKTKKELAAKQQWRWLEIWYHEPWSEEYIANKILKALS